MAVRIRISFIRPAFLALSLRALIWAGEFARPPLEPSSFAIVETIESVASIFIGKSLPTSGHRSSMKVKINQKGQITVPWLFRTYLYMQPGDDIEVEYLAPGRLILRNLTWHSPREKLDAPRDQFKIEQ